MLAGHSSYILEAKWFPCLGFLGRRYLFYDADGKHQLWLRQQHRLFQWHFIISENEEVVGEAGTNRIFTKGFVTIRDLCEFEVAFGHGLRTTFDTTTNKGEEIKILLTNTGWDVLLPSTLDDYRVLAGLALVYAAYASRD